MTASTSDPMLVSLADPRLAAVVDELTDRLQAGEAADLEAFTGRYPEHAEQIRQLIPALKMIGELKRSAGREAASPPSPGRDPRLEAGVLGDYRILREVGRGGMGVVYEAEQVSLGRHVALKVLPLAAALDSKQLQRFQLEAQAAACLHHTNIVPVHAVGCERGVPFYAMQFIEGRSLAQLIAELRQLEGLDAAEPPAERLVDISTSALAASLVSGGLARGTGRPLVGSTTAPLDKNTDEPEPTMFVSRREPDSSTRPSAGELSSTRGRAYIRTVAQLGVQVAEALDHAHTRGILHRDIKPANLLLDDQGQLWVTDFGLAQVQGNPCLTLTGDVLGTLRYMSPEQALAKRVVIDGRTDIYSLGVTLFELLTLRPAIEGQDRQEILRKIAQEEPAPPRKLNPAVPRDLETILLKAVSKEPSGRYATAKELAGELRLFLEHKPITARRPSLFDRSAKAARRHPAIVAAAGAMVLLLTCVLAIAAVFIAHERDAAQESAKREHVMAQVARQRQAEAERDRQRAEADFRRAHDAVERIFTWVAERLTDVPGMEPVRGTLLESALVFYEGFLNDHSDDPALRHEAASAAKRVAVILPLLGQHDRAEKPIRQAIALWEDLIARSPAEPSFREELAHCRDSLAAWYAVFDEKKAVVEKRKATAVYEKLALDFPQVPKYRRLLALDHMDLGIALSRPGVHEFAEAEQHYRLAIQIWDQVQADFPDLPPDPLALSGLHEWLGVLLLDTRRLEEAESELRRALALREKLVAENPAKSYPKADLEHVKGKLGDLTLRQGKLGEAERLFREAIALREPLSRDFPGVVEHRRRLGSQYRGLGQALWAMGRHRQAEEAFRVALAIRGKLAAEHPDIPDFCENLAAIHNYLGHLLEEDQRGSEAAEAFRASLQLYEGLAAKLPDATRLQVELAWFLVDCPAPKFRDEPRAIALAKRVLQVDPSSEFSWCVLGAASFRQGDWPAAVAALTKAVQLGPTDCASFLYLAMVHQRLGAREQARVWYDRAVPAVNECWPEYAGLRRLRAEAAKQLQIQDQAQAETKTAPR